MYSISMRHFTIGTRFFHIQRCFWAIKVISKGHRDLIKRKEIIAPLMFWVAFGENIGSQSCHLFLTENSWVSWIHDKDGWNLFTSFKDKEDLHSQPVRPNHVSHWRIISLESEFRHHPTTLSSSLSFLFLTRLSKVSALTKARLAPFPFPRPRRSPHTDFHLNPNPKPHDVVARRFLESPPIPPNDSQPRPARRIPPTLSVRAFSSDQLHLHLHHAENSKTTCFYCTSHSRESAQSA